MAENRDLLLDNKYQIMSEIAENKNISQRELSKKLGISLGSVNVLINKMIKEGLIKIEQISQKQVLYMLTPVGIVEKAKKTVSYLKVHYRAIYETKEKIKVLLNDLKEEYDNIFILLSGDEMGEIIKVAVDEYIIHNVANIIYVDNMGSIDSNENNKSILLYISNENFFNELSVEKINIIDIL